MNKQEKNKQALEHNTQNDHNEQIAQRKKKLHAIRQERIAFPNNFKRTHLAQEIHAAHDNKTHDELEQEQAKNQEHPHTNSNQVSLAGRIMMRRLMGKASFIHIQDMSGRIQLYIKADEVGVAVYEDFKTWDIGDIVGAIGTVFKTKTGELSIKVSSIQLLSKALRPLPDKWHGLTDQELRYRQRYLDLIVNQQSREIFAARTKIIQLVRNFLNQRNFMEVETPMMQPIPGGATARPFVTYHNTLGQNLYLRIAPELYLKRLVVGGFERVFEINRNFRNEGVSTKHNPEFTMLEFYQAYAEYTELMDLTEELLRYIATNLFGRTTVTYQGQEYDLAKPFVRMTVKESLLAYNADAGLTAAIVSDRASLATYMHNKGYNVEEAWGLGKLQFDLFEHTVEGKLNQPTFITAHPTEVSPLARCNDADPTITDRFEFFIAGRELANGFSELNDPEDQADRFRKQVEQKDAGDKEAMHYDDDYVQALEYGLPPTAGEGIGIDRLVMFFTDAASIREVILFPHMRTG